MNYDEQVEWLKSTREFKQSVRDSRIRGDILVNLGYLRDLEDKEGSWRETIIKALSSNPFNLSVPPVPEYMISGIADGSISQTKWSKRMQDYLKISKFNSTNEALNHLLYLGFKEIEDKKEE